MLQTGIIKIFESIESLFLVLSTIESNFACATDLSITNDPLDSSAATGIVFRQ